MKLTFTFVAMTLLANSALAHPGHLAEIAGHGHWIGAAALGAAIALGAWSALKGKKGEDAAGEVEHEDEELQEA